MEYLVDENRVFREPIGNTRMRFNDDQRRRLAAKAKKLGRKVLTEVATIVTPETLLAWHRKLIAMKYDGSAHRMPGRPATRAEIRTLVFAWLKRTEAGVICGFRVHWRTLDIASLELQLRTF